MQNKQIRVAFLSTYPPRECGLATFTQDLVQKLQEIPDITSHVVAISNEDIAYEEPVFLTLQQHERNDYSEIAKKLNQTGCDLLVIEHEYGIYGGKSGEYLLDLIDALTIPFVTTLHTVLSRPNRLQKKIIHYLGLRGQKIITMAANSAVILEDTYGVKPCKIAVIPHGVPKISVPSREALKKEVGMAGKTIISTFGLLGPGKGLEYGVIAMAKVAAKHPEACYMILGQTHPTIKKESGEVYRQKLESLIRKYKIEDNVIFVNRYLSKEEIVRYLVMSDMYLTPYLNMDQAVSGTLAYASGYGRVIISTPYSYAREMLSGHRGILVKKKDAKSIAKAICYILENPKEKTKMEALTTAVGEGNFWGNIAKQYRKLFQDSLTETSEGENK